MVSDVPVLASVPFLRWAFSIVHPAAPVSWFELVPSTPTLLETLPPGVCTATW